MDGCGIYHTTLTPHSLTEAAIVSRSKYKRLRHSLEVDANELWELNSQYPSIPATRYARVAFSIIYLFLFLIYS